MGCIGNLKKYLMNKFKILYADRVIIQTSFYVLSFSGKNR